MDITTVDAFASRIISTSRRPLRGGEDLARWEQASRTTGFTGTAQFLAQEYKHVVLAQNLRSLEEYEAAERSGRGSRLPTSARTAVWHTVQAFTDGLAADGLRTYLGTCGEAADVLDTKGPLYRHVVVDEAQDLHPAQWRLLRAAAPARPDDLFIAGDPHQRIYDSKVSLKSLGIKVTGRSTKMRKNYRSTHEILSWSTALLVGRPIAQLEDDARNETLLGYRSALRGSGPEVCGADSETAELDSLVERIRGWREAGIALGEIGVSARFNKTCDRVVERLKAAGIHAVRLRGDAPADADSLQVGTMHSFKGLEFRYVAVIGVNDGALPYAKAVTSADVDRLQHEADVMAERCLLFVACTRARDGLYVSWSGGPSRFLTESAANTVPPRR